MFIIRKIAQSKTDTQEGEWGNSPDLAGVLKRTHRKERKDKVGCKEVARKPL